MGPESVTLLPPSRVPSRSIRLRRGCSDRLSVHSRPPARGTVPSKHLGCSVGDWTDVNEGEKAVLGKRMPGSRFLSRGFNAGRPVSAMCAQLVGGPVSPRVRMPPSPCSASVHCPASSNPSQRLLISPLPLFLKPAPLLFHSFT